MLKSYRVPVSMATDFEEAISLAEGSLALDHGDDTFDITDVAVDICKCNSKQADYVVRFTLEARTIEV